jgi:hypothetical protein
MEFRLTYDGPLKASGGVDDKHGLRKAFHEQLKVLWKQIPLTDHLDLLADPPKKNGISVITGFDALKFAPLVCQKLHLICELDITLLRPEPPGSVVTQGGDIDNRLKTLFDSLRMPKNRNEIPSGISTEDFDSPFFCLLEDDNLITKVSVSTDRLLRENAGQNDVVILMHVVTKAVRAIWGNMGLG